MQKNIVETARDAGTFTTLIAAIDRAGLEPTLAGEGPFTVFAPSDAAFAQLPEGTVESLLAEPDKLTQVLTYHVVPGRVTAAGVVGLDEGADRARRGAVGVGRRQHPRRRRARDQRRHRSLKRAHSRDRPGAAARSDLMAVADREGRPPSRNRGARTARLGRVAVGGAVRWAGDRLDARGTEDERRRRRGDRIVSTVDALVDQLAVMRGAAMKAGQVLSTIEFPGLDEDQTAYLQARLASLRDSVPPVDWKRMHKVLASRLGRDPGRVLHDDRPRAGRGREHRAGLPRTHARRA